VSRGVAGRFKKGEDLPMALSRSLAEKRVAVAAPEPRKRAEVERSLDQLSLWMDGLFRIPGTGWRIGLDAIVGLIPGIGDFATTAVSLYILAAGVRYRVPKVTLLRMAANIGIDYLIGTIPVVGDVFDAAWKSNQMNVELLRRRAAVSAEEARHGRASDWLFLGVIVLGLLALLAGSIALSLWMLVQLVGLFR
jgi:Domain of unknown function (DUF4112)